MSKRLVLTTIWWGWGILLFLLLIALSIQSALFGDDISKVWQWFLPNIVPTMTMVGAAAYAAPQQDPTAPGAMFPFAIATSLIYLLVLSFSILATLFQAHPLGFLQQSSLWLAPLQGFASSGLALYFVKR